MREKYRRSYINGRSVRPRYRYLMTIAVDLADPYVLDIGSECPAWG
jgi:hypothetical protein